MKNAYLKHIYWLQEAEEARLRLDLEAQGIHLKKAKSVVCTPMDEWNKISSVAPEIWNDLCARQGSWYRVSDKKGLFLIISSFDLPHYRDHKKAIIRSSPFYPPRFATLPEKEMLAGDPDIVQRIPPEWFEMEELEKKIRLKWIKKLGEEVIDDEILFLSQTANHANFMKPRFYIVENSKIIPYSIDRSVHLCSCCLELFQVLGGEHEQKLVAPCPGAVIFARLKPEQYLLVEKP